MKCRHVQRKLSAYFDGELSEKEASYVSKHLSECQVCQQEAASLSSVWERLGEIQEIEPAPYFWTRLNAKISEVGEQLPVWDVIFGGLNRYLVPATLIAASFLGIWIGSALHNVYYSGTTEAWEQVATSLHLDALEDFPDQSVGSAYMELALNQSE